jgi:putative transposase
MAKRTKPTKTYRFQLGYRKQADQWFAETHVLFNRVAAFYFDVIEAHPDVLELPNPHALTALEKLTHATADNPNPPLPLSAIAQGLPAMFRRAAIQAALGAARSFHSHLDRWRTAKVKAEERGQRFTQRPPVPPRRWNKRTVFYAGMHKQFDGHTILLKVWTGTAWSWVKFNLHGRPLPEGWKMNSPQVVRRGKQWSLHLSVTHSDFSFPAKAETQLADPSTRLCAVDLNINDALAVCTIQNADGTVRATRFIRGGRAAQGRRKRALGRVAVKRSQTGVIHEMETDNAKRFRYIRHLDNNVAHRVSRRIVEFACEYGASLVVFEHLGHFKPERGKYSQRGNDQRTYWLRGRIFRYTQYKAWEEGILTCRVNPRDTSRLCAECGQPVARYNVGESPTEYRPGAPLFLCPNCLKRGNADRNASVNIGHRLIERYRTHSEKPHPVSATAEQCPQGQGVAVSYSTPAERSDAQRAREQGKPRPEARPSSRGADDGVGTARGTPRSLRPQRSGGYAANTPSADYPGMPKEAAGL